MFNFLFSKTPLFYLVQPLWRDEAFSYLLAKKNLWEIISLSLKEFTPPLYYLLLHFWIKIFGSSEIALRSLSYVFYWLTVYIVFLIFADVFKIKIKKALLYLIFIVINPLLVYYSFEARGYTLFSFLAILSFYFLYKKNKYYFLTVILGLFTHYFMIFVVLSQYLIFKNKKILKSLIIFVPWLILVFLNHKNQSFNFWIKSFNLTDLYNSLAYVFLGYEKEFLFFKKKIFFVSLFLWLIIFLGYLRVKPQSKYKKIFSYFFLIGVIIPILFMIFSLLIKPVFLPRYLIFANISLIIFLIVIAEFSLGIKKIFFICLIILLGISSLKYHYLQIINRKKTDLRKNCREIKAILKKEDLVYVKNELDFFVAQYYLNEDQVFIYNKTYQEIPQYVGKILIPKNKIVQILPVYPKRAFIIDEKGQYTISALY